jgi:hypothetical protein
MTPATRHNKNDNQLSLHYSAIVWKWDNEAWGVFAFAYNSNFQLNALHSSSVQWSGTYIYYVTEEGDKCRLLAISKNIIYYKTRNYKSITCQLYGL